MTGGAIKDQACTGTSKGLSQTINRGPIRKFLPKYANVNVTFQSHGLSAGAWTHYVTANGVRNGVAAGVRPPLPAAGACRGQGWLQGINMNTKCAKLSSGTLGQKDRVEIHTWQRLATKLPIGVFYSTMRPIVRSA